MRSGLEGTSIQNYGRWVSSRNWVRYALDRPMVSEPGTGRAIVLNSSNVEPVTQSPPRPPRCVYRTM